MADQLKTKYYKEGNPELHNYFSDEERESQTPQQRAMWTPYSDMEAAPIPDDVLNFKKEAESQRITVLEKEVKKLQDEKDKLLETLREDKIDKLHAPKKEEKPKADDDLGTSDPPPHVPKSPSAEKEKSPDAEKKLLQEECRKRGIRFAHNSGIPRLQELLKENK